MLSALGFVAAVLAIAVCTILLIVGFITVATDFVQDFIDRHERRCHREDGTRSTADGARTTASADGK